MVKTNQYHMATSQSRALGAPQDQVLKILGKNWEKRSWVLSWREFFMVDWRGSVLRAFPLPSCLFLPLTREERKEGGHIDLFTFSRMTKQHYQHKSRLVPLHGVKDSWWMKRLVSQQGMVVAGYIVWGLSHLPRYKCTWELARSETASAVVPGREIWQL